MSDIYNGLLAQLDLIEDFYHLSVKEQVLINKIKKGLKELIKIYDKENKDAEVHIDSMLFID